MNLAPLILIAACTAFGLGIHRQPDHFSRCLGTTLVLAALCVAITACDPAPTTGGAVPPPTTVQRITCPDEPEAHQPGTSCTQYDPQLDGQHDGICLVLPDGSHVTLGRKYAEANNIEGVPCPAQ